MWVLASAWPSEPASGTAMEQASVPTSAYPWEMVSALEWVTAWVMQWAHRWALPTELLSG